MDDPLSFILMNHVSTPYLGLIIACVLLFFLLTISALVSGSEVAFFSLSPQQHETLKNSKLKPAEMVLELLAAPKNLLAIIIIINNFVNIGIIVLSPYILAGVPGIEGFRLAHPTLYFLIEVVGITFVILLFGEVIPKLYATKNPMRLAKFMAPTLKTLQKIPPFSWIQRMLINGTDYVNKRAKKHMFNVSSNELGHALALTKEENSSEEEHKILEGIVNFGNKDVKQIMRSRVDAIAFDISMSYDELIREIIESGFSRVPVYRDSLDNIEGILYIKDLLPHLTEGVEFPWQNFIRTPFFVPENKKIDDLLKDFQSMKMHIAIVVDEYGGMSGIVTLEDVLEEIVGDITDEFDDGIEYSKLDEFNYLFEGKIPLVDMYKVLDIDGKLFEDAKGDSDSLAGFLIEQSGKILRKNEKLQFGNLQFVVEAADTKRVKMVKVTLLSKD